MADHMTYDDKLEKLISLPIGKVRELLAYADGDESLDDWLDDLCPAFLEEDDDWCSSCDEEEDDWEDDEELDEEEDWDEEEEYSDDEDWDDVEDGEQELADPEEEQLAQDIAGDIAWGKYNLEDIPEGVYSPEIMDRIKYLI